MFDPTEIATVIANGMNFTNWTSLRVDREFGKPFAYANLTLSEPGSTSEGWNNLALKPGDQATVQLAGQQAVAGTVIVRQPAYTADSHAVNITIAGNSYKANTSTVDGQPGQYLNSNYQQIASAVLGKIGIGFSLVGNPSGADLVFDRVNEMIGETRYAFLERLARMRWLHLVDDANGNVVATRGGTGSNVVATLIEGVNILKADAVFKIDEFADSVTGIGQHQGSDAQWGDAARDISCTVNPTGLSVGVPLKFLAEQPCNQAELQLRTNHEADWQYMTMIDAVVTVKGWLTDSGALWILQVPTPAMVTLQSPMLWPGDPLQLWLKGARHLQDNEGGTRTELILTRTLSQGAVQGVGAGSDGPFSGATATPDPPDAAP